MIYLQFVGLDYFLESFGSFLFVLLGCSLVILFLDGLCRKCLSSTHSLVHTLAIQFHSSGADDLIRFDLKDVIMIRGRCFSLWFWRIKCFLSILINSNFNCPHLNEDMAKRLSWVGYESDLFLITGAELICFWIRKESSKADSFQFSEYRPVSVRIRMLNESWSR